MEDKAPVTPETREPEVVDVADNIAIEELPPDERAEAARAYLGKRMQLLDLQVEHFEKEVASRLRSERLQRRSEWLKIAAQVLLIVAGFAVVGGFSAMMWWASRSESVVVEAFDVPPNLAEKGDTGRVVASALLDELDKMQAVTRGAASKLALKTAWSGDIKIDVPETGVSLGEVQRVLRENLGHDQHIGGTLVEQADGTLTLSVRGDGIRPKAFTGPATDLTKLERQAAEYVYGEAQPYLYGVYLDNAGRFDEAIAFVAQAYPRASDSDRPNLANTWAIALQQTGKWREAAAKYRLALAVNPHFWKGWGNLVIAATYIDGEEAAYHVAMEMRAAAQASPPDDQPSELQMNAYYNLVQDNSACLHVIQEDARRNNGLGSMSSIDGPQLADFEAALYDFPAAEKYLATSDPDDPSTKSEALALEIYRAINDEDYARAVAPADASYKMYLAAKDIQYLYASSPCYAGLAYGMTGRRTEAEVAFAHGGRQVLCYSFRAQVIDHSGDWGGAVNAYRDAIALAPSLPLAYDFWGQALARHGDLYGAMAAYREANKRGPHWADPLKHWGDVLLRQKKIAEAHAKYVEALQYAPQWPDLKAAAAKTVAGR